MRLMGRSVKLSDLYRGWKCLSCTLTSHVDDFVSTFISCAKSSILMDREAQEAALSARAFQACWPQPAASKSKGSAATVAGSVESLGSSAASLSPACHVSPVRSWPVPSSYQSELQLLHSDALLCDSFSQHALRVSPVVAPGPLGSSEHGHRILPIRSHMLLLCFCSHLRSHLCLLCFCSLF